MILDKQMRFVLGRSILEGIIIVQEVIHSIHRSNKKCMLIKLDIKRAYDFVDQIFLCKVSEAFGFDSQWMNWMLNWIASRRLSILLNGTPKCYYEASRGIKQGNPLSFFFIVMVEALGREISLAVASGRLEGI